jgi:hypothetical protein
MKGRANGLLGPAVACLPAPGPVERRNVPAREALLRRIHREFEEMPGLPLALEEAAKLLGISSDASARILPQLVDARVLRLRSDGRYVLRTARP